MDGLKMFFTWLLCFMLVSTARASVKKGLVHMIEDFKCDDFKLLNNFAWWYDYLMDVKRFRQKNTCPPSEFTNAYMDKHVPMIWGLDWPIKLGNYGDYVLLFNEPNHEEQSNMSPEMAFDRMSEIKQKAKGRQLVSPSAAICGANCIGTPFEWFDRFFELCKYCQIDYIATHTFMCNANKVMKYLKELYDRYQKKIWLTEIACGEVTDPKIQLIFMKQILPRLEEAEYIFRYAWYKTRITESHYVTTAASLMEPNSSKLTKLGELYLSYQGGDIPLTDDEESSDDSQAAKVMGFEKNEVEAIIKAYEADPTPWWNIFESLEMVLPKLSSEAAAFYMSAEKKDKKNRIKQILQTAICIDSDEIEDLDLRKEAERIKKLPKGKKMQQSLRRPKC